MSKKLLNDKQTSEMINVSTRFLQHDRVTKRRIPFIKIGRFVRYREEDLEKFLEENRYGGEAA